MIQIHGSTTERGRGGSGGGSGGGGEGGGIKNTKAPVVNALRSLYHARDCIMEKTHECLAFFGAKYSMPAWIEERKRERESEREWLKV